MHIIMYTLTAKPAYVTVQIYTTLSTDGDINNTFFTRASVQYYSIKNNACAKKQTIPKKRKYVGMRNK